MKLNLVIVILIILCMTYCFKDDEDGYVYRDFWTNEKNIDESIKKYFKILLDPLEIKKRVFIHSVFNDLLYTQKETLHILFSGESWNRGLNNYNVKLIMEDTDISNGIICHPYFIVDSYVYNYWPIYMNIRSPVRKSKFCIFVASNDYNYDINIRNRFFKKLSQYKKVDSAGSAFNNIGMRAPRNDISKGDYSYYNFLSEYKFMICFENTSKSNYLTEKLANAYLGKTIPIYWGASKVREWCNNNAILQLEESASDKDMDILISRIKEIDNDDMLYDEIYKQPLMYEIPEDLNINKIREKIKMVIN